MHNDPVGHVDLWGLTASDSSFTSRIQIDDVNSAIANLTTAQKMTREAPMYQYEAGGNYNLPGPGKSWCNQSTFDVMEATGFHTEGLFVTEGSYTGRYNTNANYASASLKKLSDNSDETGIVEVTPKEAQLYANKGATVVAAWEGNITADGNQAKGHMSTVFILIPIKQ